MMPHLPYADAVHATLVAAGYTPDRVDVGEDDHGEPYATFTWPEDGITLRWTAGLGWRHDAPHSAGPLMVDGIADPAAIVATVRQLADGDTPPADLTRWNGAAELDRALSDRAI